MSTIKNDQNSLYWHFNKIIKGPGTRLQSPALSQNILECILPYFILIVLRIQKK